MKEGGKEGALAGAGSQWGKDVAAPRGQHSTAMDGGTGDPPRTLLSLCPPWCQQGGHLEKQIHLPSHTRMSRELEGSLEMAPGMSPGLTWNVGVKVATCGLGASGDA